MIQNASRHVLTRYLRSAGFAIQPLLNLRICNPRRVACGVGARQYIWARVVDGSRPNIERSFHPIEMSIFHPTSSQYHTDSCRPWRRRRCSRCC